MKYTVRQATATGKSDATYGDEYIVHFNEDDREVKLSRKQPVVAGQVENGNIIDGKYGAYFKKDPYNPNAPKVTAQASPTATTSTPSKATSSYRRTDNSDGMRQGMSINNAANYVNSLNFDGPLTDREWAEMVHAYASALYALGDLKLPITEETVAGVFGAN